MTREEAAKVLEKQFDESCGDYRYQNKDKLDYEDALWLAIAALRTLDAQENQKPLTLDELRKMNGEPVWCVSMINGKAEWAIIRVIEMSKTWFIAIAGASAGYGDKDTYGDTWLAYRHKPKEETK